MSKKKHQYDTIFVNITHHFLLCKRQYYVETKDAKRQNYEENKDTKKKYFKKYYKQKMNQKQYYNKKYYRVQRVKKVCDDK